MMAPRHRAVIAAALAVAALFFAFAGDGLRAYFTPDDMMNLYVSWSATPSALLHQDRPLGALVYRAMFAVFGLDPVPYRVLCFALLLANLALLYRFCRRISGSREIGALACLLGAYHAHLADLYYSTGTLFDLLCCLFFLLAFNFYLRIRETGYPSWPQTAGLLLLYACALASKEMAVTLPVYVAVYEWIFHRKEWRRAASMPFLWIGVPLTAAYALWKVAGPHAMTANPAYAQHLSLHAFLAASKSYLNDLFYGAIGFNTFKLMLLWIVLIGIAAAARRKEIWFAWCVLMLGVLPFVFIPPRGFFVMYLVLPGWYLFAAASLVTFREWLPAAARWLTVGAEQLALFVSVLLLLLPLHHAEKPGGMAWVAGSHQQVRAVLGELAARYPALPRGSKVLFLSDPYEPDDWILTSMFRLQYSDPDLHVDRVKSDPSLAARQSEYAHVFVLDAAGLRTLR
ncbi:MAG TPA: glycosyltransferase family 39 protein [Candidatus Sulfopaludibacter sp.]|jgi:hypothetical protein|nr:glycosyltransferase family 39 protein [Candidatus Sulfopaludibacter sp.]